MEILVRDRVPDIIAADGGMCDYRIAPSFEWGDLLIQKLDSEADALIEAIVDDREDLMEEFADLLQVLVNLAGIHNINFNDVIDFTNAKKVEMGDYTKFYVLKID